MTHTTHTWPAAELCPLPDPFRHVLVHSGTSCSALFRSVNLHCPSFRTLSSTERCEPLQGVSLQENIQRQICGLCHDSTEHQVGAVWINPTTLLNRGPTEIHFCLNYAQSTAGLVCCIMLWHLEEKYLDFQPLFAGKQLASSWW